VDAACEEQDLERIEARVGVSSGMAAVPEPASLRVLGLAAPLPRRRD
jgi:hypothetical protein